MPRSPRCSPLPRSPAADRVEHGRQRAACAESDQHHRRRRATRATAPRSTPSSPRSTTSRGNMAVALEELRIADGGRSELRAGLQHVRPGLHGPAREQAGAGEFRARAAPVAERSRHQPQLRLVPVPDRARGRIDQVLPAGGAQSALPDAVALVFRGRRVRAAQEQPEGGGGFLPARAAAGARRSGLAAAARPDPLPPGQPRGGAQAGAAATTSSSSRPRSRSGSRCASSASSASASRKRATRTSCGGASPASREYQLLQRGEYD